MPSSISSSSRATASDRPGVAQPVPVRDIPFFNWAAVLCGALLLTGVLVGGWEWHWRAVGAVPGYRDDDALWSLERRRIDRGDGAATVLIGSSRTLFDTQLPAWEHDSGRRPIQLSLNGNSPLPVLEDLASDTNFTGRLIVGIAPDVFFSGFFYRRDLLPYFKKESPSQRVGKFLSMHLVEPWFAFYDEEFALFTDFRRLPWPPRGGRGPPDVHKLAVTAADRNVTMWQKVITDEAYRALARSIWTSGFRGPPPTPASKAEDQRTQTEQIARAAAAVAKLTARHVPVVFVREPSAGEYFAYELKDYPRESTWDLLLKQTGAAGIHFEDFPQLQGYDLPEWSHMTKESAEKYTDALYQILECDHAPADGARW